VPDRRDERKYRAAKVWRKEIPRRRRTIWLVRFSREAPPKICRSSRCRLRTMTTANGRLSNRLPQGDWAQGERPPGKIVLTGNSVGPAAEPPTLHRSISNSSSLDEQPPIELTAVSRSGTRNSCPSTKPDDGRAENPKLEISSEMSAYPGPNDRFRSGGWVPIFYLDDGKGGIESFGLAFMFKMAHEKANAGSPEETANRRHPDGATSLDDAEPLKTGADREDGTEGGEDLPSLYLRLCRRRQRWWLEAPRGRSTPAIATLISGAGSS